MLTRDDELDRMKEVNLTLIAAELGGYEVVRKKSTRHSVLMDSGNDKIIVSKSGNHYVFCSVNSPTSGTAIDFVQQLVEPNCSLGQVRKHLRPFLDGGYVSNIKTKREGQYAEGIRPSKVDFNSVAARFSRFETITKPHTFLCGDRGIPFELLQHPKVHGLVRHSPRFGSVVFPHWGQPGDDPADQTRCLVGYEIKDSLVSLYARGGRSGLFMTRASKHDRRIVFCESGLDALSYLAVNNCIADTRVVSIAGQLNQQFQIPLIESAIKRMGEETEVVAGFDADSHGDKLTEQLNTILSSTARSDLVFADHRPLTRGWDWNDIVRSNCTVAQTRAFTP